MTKNIIIYVSEACGNKEALIVFVMPGIVNLVQYIVLTK